MKIKTIVAANNVGQINYTVGRIFGLITRPLALFIATQYLSHEAAQGIAISYLACALALIVTAADVHRKFYLRYFTDSVSAKGLSFYIYLFNLLITTVLGGLFICVFASLNHISVELLFSILFYYSSEKITDEVFRFRLFEKKFAKWGELSFFRCVCQLIGLAVLLVVFEEKLDAWMVIFVFGFSNMLVFIPQVNSLIFKFATVPSRVTLLWIGRRAVKSLAGNREIWLFACIMASWGYIDRIIALVMDKDILAIFMLVAICFSLIPTIFDFYYLSRHRKDFLENKISIRKGFLSIDFILCLSIGILLSFLTSMAVIHYIGDDSGFPLGILPGLAAIHLLLTVTHVPHQILYWSKEVRVILKVEIIAVTLAIFGFLTVSKFQFSIAEVLYFIVACLIVRFTLYLLAERKLKNSDTDVEMLQSNV